jgi:signal recognition particle subunit SRP54
MFENLSDRLELIFKKLKGHGKLSASNIKEAMRDVRRALLEADVNYRVAKDFVQQITEKAAGQEVLKSITPGQQVVKVVHEALAGLLGGTAREPVFSGSAPHTIMMVGLQGSGKTTMSAKLALYFRKKGRRPLLVAADVYRPAAVTQLEVLGKSIEIPVFTGDKKHPVKVCRASAAYAKEHERDLVIFDTAGRLHIDDAMMNELEKIAGNEKPDEIFFTADAMTGQDAVNAALEFNKRLNFTGVVLTKMDGDARGGAALSVLSVTGKPIRFAGVGEKVDQLELFHPDRLASRILGMGDVVSLVEKAQETMDEEKAKKLEKKMLKAQFTFEDFKDQLAQIRNMGPLDQLLGMIPGIGKQIKGLNMDERAFDRIVAIINSMTKKERVRPAVIDGSRRKRIARGSGTSVNDVNKLLKQFFEMQKVMKNMGKMMGRVKEMKGLMGNLGLKGGS